jgi:hypothetical protein
MHSLSLHRVNNIEITTKSLDKGDNKMVNLVVTSDNDTRFEVTCFLDNEKGFKAINLLDLIKLSNLL